MAEIVNMPKLGFDMKEGVLVRWVIQEGEKVQKGDVIAEIETDKATVEVESSHTGLLYKQLVETDTSVPVGDPIAVVADEDEEVDVDSLLGGEEKKGKVEKEDKKKEKKAEKEKEKKPEPQPEPEVEPEIDKETGEVRIYETEEGKRIKASPLARNIAEDKNINLASLKGSGPGGRIVKKDVEAAVDQAKTKPEPQPEPVKVKAAAEIEPDKGVALPQILASGAPERKEEKVSINKLRQAIGRRMTESKQEVPHFYLTHIYNMDGIMRLRSQANETLPDEQKLSVNDFLIKAVALTLRDYPNLNASIDGKELVRHGSINIGVAVAVEGGLLTVVVKDADVKPIRMISTEVKEMAARVRSGKVRSEDVEGSTFSISNLGMFDVENFAAIINPPEGAILAVASAKKVPVVIDEEIKIAWQMKATISVDHRISDGAEAAKFMQDMVFQVENPMRLLL